VKVLVRKVNREADNEELFEFLDRQSASTLLDLLKDAYAAMSTGQHRTVFGKFAKKQKSFIIDGNKVQKRVQQFHQDSFKGVYYAPFEINSKNYMNIPEETKEWFDRLAQLLEDSTKLTVQGEHSYAIKCFSLLYELIRAIGLEEIVFADEVGTWMIPADEKEFIKAYFSSLAAIATPEEFTAATLSIIRDDSKYSFTNQAYSIAIHAAKKEQRAYPDAEIKRQKIPTTSDENMKR
jgi:hypothetical protein